MDTIKEQVLDVVAETLAMEKDALTLDKTFSEMNVDSLDMVELTMGIEEAFDIEISDEDAMEITTIQSAIDVVKKTANSDS